jgi:hypothetical protein
MADKRRISSCKKKQQAVFKTTCCKLLEIEAGSIQGQAS